MGANACCTKPDEKSELKGGQNNQQNLDTDQANTLDKDGYPHDSEAQVENEALRAVSNQQLYNNEVQSPKVGNSYQVSVEVKSPNQNEQQENIENAQSPNPGDTDAKDSNMEKKEVNSPKQEEPEDEEPHDGQREEQGEVKSEKKGEEKEEEKGEGEEGEEGEELEEEEEDVEEEGEGEGEEKIEQDNKNINLGVTIGETQIIDNNIVNQEAYPQNQYSQNEFNSYFKSGDTFITTTSNQGAVDLNNLQYLSSNGNDGLNNYYQQGAIISSDTGNYEYNTGNISAVPVISNDYNQYSTNGNLDVNNYNIGSNSTIPAPTNIDLNNYDFKGTGNFDMNNYNVVSGTTDNIGYDNTNTYSVPAGNLGSTLTFGEKQGTNEYNEYGTNNIKNSYVSPVQSYSYNYSYTVPGNSNQTNF